MKSASTVNTAELRDETTELARKYGIVTPVHPAYLIVEDEDRRRVPDG